MRLVPAGLLSGEDGWRVLLPKQAGGSRGKACSNLGSSLSASLVCWRTYASYSCWVGYGRQRGYRMSQVWLLFGVAVQACSAWDPCLGQACTRVNVVR